MKRTTKAEAQHGATLIEVLITVLILAVGLLGVAGMQMTSIQSNHSAYYRTQATVLAADLAERMRANREVALTTAYNLDFPTSSSGHSVSGSQAQKDLAEWLNTLADTLPEGTGKIEKDSSLVIIHVRWNDNRGRIKASNDTTTPSETFIYRTEI